MAEYVVVKCRLVSSISHSQVKCRYISVPKAVCERRKTKDRDPGWTGEQSDNDRNNKTSNDLKGWEGE
jgi:hypothetical protein